MMRLKIRLALARAWWICEKLMEVPEDSGGRPLDRAEFYQNSLIGYGWEGRKTNDESKVDGSAGAEQLLGRGAQGQPGIDGAPEEQEAAANAEGDQYKDDDQGGGAQQLRTQQEGKRRGHEP